MNKDEIPVALVEQMIPYLITIEQLVIIGKVHRRAHRLLDVFIDREEGERDGLMITVTE